MQTLFITNIQVTLFICLVHFAKESFFLCKEVIEKMYILSLLFFSMQYGIKKIEYTK